MSPSRILVIDDDEAVAEIVCLRLRRFGYETEACGDAVQADRHIAKRKPDAIILDVAMPGLSGPDYRERLSKDPATAEIPVIFVTAFRGRTVDKKIPESPRVRLHFKPVNFDLLRQQLQELLPASGEAPAS